MYNIIDFPFFFFSYKISYLIMYSHSIAYKKFFYFYLNPQYDESNKQYQKWRLNIERSSYIEAVCIVGNIVYRKQQFNMQQIITAYFMFINICIHYMMFIIAFVIWFCKICNRIITVTLSWFHKAAHVIIHFQFTTWIFSFWATNMLPFIF